MNPINRSTAAALCALLIAIFRLAVVPGQAQTATDQPDSPGCHLSPQGAKEMAGLARGHVLQFKAGAYRRR
jgi:hypothetical protein